MAVTRSDTGSRAILAILVEKAQKVTKIRCQEAFDLFKMCLSGSHFGVMLAIFKENRQIPLDKGDYGSINSSVL